MSKRRLVILRHAKSSWTSDAPDDHSRPLNKRGRRDAPRIGEHLDERGWLPRFVISSDSQRTRLTVKGVFSEIRDAPEIHFTRSLYHAGLAAIEEAVCTLATEEDAVMVVGHNPGFEDAVERLSGTYHRFTTCNAAVFDVDAPSWSDAFDAGEFELVALVRPKEI
jgi:phosphohistidine phosphatase